MICSTKLKSSSCYHKPCGIAISAAVTLAVTAVVCTLLALLKPMPPAALWTVGGVGVGITMLLVLRALCHVKRREEKPEKADSMPEQQKTPAKNVKKRPIIVHPQNNPRSNSTSLLAHFYLGDGEDIQNRTFEDILRFDDARLESAHDYIQWLFPNPGGSGVSSTAPDFTAEMQVQIGTSDIGKARALRAFERLLHFYGLKYENDEVQKGNNWEARKTNWLTPGNHNYLRITRILIFLRLMGMKPVATAFFAQLKEINTQDSRGRMIPENTLTFWQNALFED